jgi:pimeloyl-ACP methyl ester carboxylesterase
LESPNTDCKSRRFRQQGRAQRRRRPDFGIVTDRQSASPPKADTLQLNVGGTKLSGMIRKFICPMVGYLMLAASAHGETVGVVMMHGKHGTPAQLQQLAAAVANAGFLVERPEMCWSAARIYDRTYLECLADIDAAAARLKERGATAVVVLGMSLGGNAALGFGARRHGLKAIIALARAHAPEFLGQRPEIAPRHRQGTGGDCRW